LGLRWTQKEGENRKEEERGQKQQRKEEKDRSRKLEKAILAGGSVLKIPLGRGAYWEKLTRGEERESPGGEAPSPFEKRLVTRKSGVAWRSNEGFSVKRKIRSRKNKRAAHQKKRGKSFQGRGRKNLDAGEKEERERVSSEWRKGKLLTACQSSFSKRKGRLRRYHISERRKEAESKTPRKRKKGKWNDYHAQSSKRENSTINQSSMV